MKKTIFSLLIITISYCINAQDNIVNTGNLQIHSGANLVFFGNFTNNGTYAQNSGTFTFDGTGAQTLSGSGSTTFYNLVINNTSSTGVTFSGGNVVVTNLLTLTDGMVYTNNSNLLVLNDGATVSGGSSDSYIIGPVKKIGDESFTYHIGKTGYYMPISITAPSNATDAFTAEYFRTDPKSTFGSSKDVSLNKVTDNEYWQLDRTTGSSNVTVTLYWNGNTSNIGNLNDLRVTQWNGSLWSNLGNASTTGTTSAGSLTASSSSSNFGGFAFGTVSNLNPLPVTLMSFTAKLNNDVVDLDWTTATEVNNDYFTVEKTINGKDFIYIDKIDGAGNSSQKLNYHTIDPQPFDGISYYRLKQTNYDNTFSYSNLVPVNVIKNNGINIYPNPTADGKISLVFKNLIEPNSIIQVSDIKGKIVFSENIGTIEFSKYYLNLNFLSKGLYFVKLINNSITETNKLIIQ